VLAGILAGELEPSAGRCLRSGTVHYLAQRVAHPDQASVAGLAGVQATMDALERIGAGSTSPADFDPGGDRWDIGPRPQHALERNGRGHLNPGPPLATLSGGEAMRVALIGAVLSDADFLILDEPSNHLDRANRRLLSEQLQRWPKGL